MKTLDDIRRVLQTEQPRLHERYGLKVLGIFGSYSRGEQTPESDVDILVEFDGEKQLTIFDDLYIAEYLAEKLGIKVDLVEKNLLHPRVAKYVLPELRTL